MDLYRENILDHYSNPRHWGLLRDAQVEAKGTNSLCGDEITVQLEVNSGVVSNMRFEGSGCAVSRAAASLLSEYIVGSRDDEVKGLGLRDMEKLLGVALPPARIKCALLGLETTQLALARLGNRE